MNFKAAIFDMDGTLLNTLNSIGHFCNKALTSNGFEPAPVDDYRYLVGEGPEVLVQRLMKRYNGDKAQYEAVLKEFIEGYKSNFLYKIDAYDGMRELILVLKDKGIKLGILTNKDEATAQLLGDEIFGTDTFDACYGYIKNRPLKPDPKGFFDMAKEFGVDPKECVYLGDTATDMKLGKSGGAFTVGVLWGFRDYKELKENNADLIIEKPLELMKIFD